MRTDGSLNCYRLIFNGPSSCSHLRDCSLRYHTDITVPIVEANMQKTAIFKFAKPYTMKELAHASNNGRTFTYSPFLECICSCSCINKYFFVYQKVFNIVQSTVFPFVPIPLKYEAQRYFALYIHITYMRPLFKSGKIPSC